MKLNILFLLSFPAILTSCNGQSPKVVHSQNSTGDTVEVPGNNIMIIYQDKKNTYWFGSWEDGVYRYDGKTMLHFTTKDGLPHNRIDEIKEDKLGNIYFSTSGGISKFDGKKFNTLPVLESNEWKLQPGDLWFKCTQGSGQVYRYDGKSLFKLKFPKHYMEGEYFTVNEKHSWSPYDVYCIYKDSRGNIWFGTAVLGACRYDGKTIDWISEEDVTEFHKGPSNGVRSIIEDKDGYFWFNSIYRYNIYGNVTSEKGDSSKQKFYTKEKGIGSLDGKKDSDLNEYLSIAKDNNNELWIATYRNGVWHYDGNSVSHYSVKDGSKDITLFYIYKDNYGDLWLGTHETGAYKFNGKTFERFKP